MLAEKFYDAVEDLAIGDGLAAFLAIENDDGHAPNTLPRDAPIGPRGHHVGDAFFTPRGHPGHSLDGLERPLAEIVQVHADEPLLGGAKDHGVVAAPAMRIGMRQFLEA